MTISVGFLGAGQMATALARGWLAAGLIDRATAAASDPHPPAWTRFAADTGIRVVDTNPAVLAACPVVVLAVKPQVLPAVLSEIRPHVTPDHLFVSIAAGVTLDQLADHLGPSTRVIRVMPNTPALVGSSASAYTAGPAATAADAALVGKLLAAVGVAFPVPEKLLDAVTGLSGSGPAFVYVFIEALADGGVRAGLPREVALKLAAQTVLGSAKMVLETGTHPAALKDAVASPGGTTIAGLHALERAAFRAAAMDAVEAATRRSQELGKKE
jgi:pyrroline-5-carboxylate reductase